MADWANEPYTMPVLTGRELSLLRLMFEYFPGPEHAYLRPQYEALLEKLPIPYTGPSIVVTLGGDGTVDVRDEE